MPRRYLNRELQYPTSPDYLNDFRLIQSLINDRKETVTNVYAPLYERLSKLEAKIYDYVRSGTDIEDITLKEK